MSGVQITVVYWQGLELGPLDAGLAAKGLRVGDLVKFQVDGALEQGLGDGARCVLVNPVFLSRCSPSRGQFHSFLFTNCQ